MQKTFVRPSGYHYLLFLPEKYLDTKENWPLILYLHGMKECGNDLKLLKSRGIPKIAEEMEHLIPFLVVSPQCPKGQYWLPDMLSELLDTIEAEHRVDRKRVYLTGITLGGYGTWRMAAEHPERFAAIAPVCCGGMPDAACIVKDIPSWVFHAEQDVEVPISEAQEMVDALKKCGGNVKFTVLQGDHGVCSEPYYKPELYTWFLKHERESR